MLQRRTILAAGLTGGLAAPLVPRPAHGAGTVRLRLLETSDLHMFIYDFDYYKDRPDPTVGLAKTATLIDEARAQAPNHMLFDNGDIIQGSPLGDYLAKPGHLPDGVVHPMFRAMNDIGYDAATLGNHEFNFGLPFLQRATAGARFPFVCANLNRVDGASYVPPTTVLLKKVRAEDGTEHTLRIGVIGFVPPQIMAWDKANLEGRVTAGDIVEAGLRELPALRAKSDLVVALCHSGIDAGVRAGGDENAAYFLARDVKGIDVVFTGHAHQVFPGPAYANIAGPGNAGPGSPGIDAVRGTLAGVPAVMPGFWGSHLGVIDLVLAQGGDGSWAVSDFKVEARPIYRREAGKVVPLAAADKVIVDEVRPEHEQTIAWAAQPVGMLQVPVNSYFSLVGPDPSVAIVSAGQLWYARRLFAETGKAPLPMLSAAAPFKAGQTSPDNYVDLPAGPLSLRNIADLYVFANIFVVVQATGAQVREWLERSAGLFRQIDPAKDGPQELIEAAFPAYNYDVISGVTYQVDVTQPSRYGADGKLAHPEAHRITDLRYQGQPIDPAMTFAVVTNNYRSDGGGNFPGMGAAATTVLRGPDQNRDAILHWVEAVHEVGRDLPPPAWSFRPASRPLKLAFDCAPAARSRLPEHPGIADAGEGANGFARFVLTVPAA